MNIKIKIDVGSSNFDQSYTVFETRAPRAYDYHGVIQVEDAGDIRLVAIPDEDVPMQTARYMSGMYAAQGVPEFTDENVLLDLIVARLINRS